MLCWGEGKVKKQGLFVFSFARARKALPVMLCSYDVRTRTGGFNPPKTGIMSHNLKRNLTVKSDESMLKTLFWACFAPQTITSKAPLPTPPRVSRPCGIEPHGSKVTFVGATFFFSHLKSFFIIKNTTCKVLGGTQKMQLRRRESEPCGWPPTKVALQCAQARTTGERSCNWL